VPATPSFPGDLQIGISAEPSRRWAVDSGLTMVLATAGLFLVAEPLAGQVIEPVLYGHHTGLSPVAIVNCSERGDRAGTEARTCPRHWVSRRNLPRQAEFAK
jgi:hypothetical protein